MYKLNVNTPKITMDFKGNYLIGFDVCKDSVQAIKNLANELKDKDKYTIEIKTFRNKRSLTANAYLWVLLEKLAVALRTSKDELYIQTLERYGKFTHIVVKPSAVESFKKEWRAVRDLGEVAVNGQTGIQLQCYFGSSTYDTKEMAYLLDGVVSECDDLGIETDLKMKILLEGGEEYGKHIAK